MHKRAAIAALTATFTFVGVSAVALAATPDKQPHPSPAPSPVSLQLLWSGAAPDIHSTTSTVASATDPVTGDIWVAVPFEDQYWIFKPDGTYIESWGTSGSDPGQLDLTDSMSDPDGWGPIAFAPDGSFVIGDTGNDRVQLFDKDRTFVRAWGSFGSDDGQFTQIISVATDGTTVVVGDGTRYDLQTFDMQGNHLATFGGDIGADTVAMDPSGHVVAVNPQNPAGAPMTLTTYGLDGTVVSTVDLGLSGSWPVWVATDAAGNRFVEVELDHYPYTSFGTLEYGPDGTLLRHFAEGADTVSISPDGSVLYLARGVQIDPTIWHELKAYAIPPLR
jgi:hypothetical protein